MSWDIFVQDLPREASVVSEIPNDFVPKPLERSRAQIIAAIRELEPQADFTDPSLGKITGPGYTIDVNLGDTEVVQSFAFHAYGGGQAARVIARVLESLGLRALDPGSETGFFEDPTSEQSFENWQEYRDRVVEADPDGSG